MRIKAYNLIALALVIITGMVSPKVLADSAASEEYQVKAAFLYNFIKFIDWPREKMADSNDIITIGIIGKDPFGKSFRPIENKQVKGRNVIIKRFKGLKDLEDSKEKNKSALNKQIEEIKKCHLLFICRSEKQKLKKILNMVKGHHVLTVADTEGFLEAGSIIEFVMVERKVRFGINMAAGKQAKLKIRSQLLRLAEKIVEEEG
jgi:hypothetical protein